MLEECVLLLPPSYINLELLIKTTCPWVYAWTSVQNTISESLDTFFLTKNRLAGLCSSFKMHTAGKKINKWIYNLEWKYHMNR